MGLQLPGELVAVMSAIGFQWPKGDEEKLFEMAQVWQGFAGTLRGQTEAAAELSPSAREAQLHAAAELVEWHPGARSAAAAVASIDPATVSASEQEHLEFLTETDG